MTEQAPVSTEFDLNKAVETVTTLAQTALDAGLGSEFGIHIDNISRDLLSAASGTYRTHNRFQVRKD